jgi:hypothetical protein
MKIGDIVLCINDSFIPLVIRLIPNKPKKGKIYTVREIVTHGSNNKVGILLEEISNEPILLPSIDGLFEPSFDINRFISLDIPMEINEIVNELWQEKVN